MYILVHTHTYISVYLLPVRDLLPRKNKRCLGSKHKDETGMASSCSAYRGTATTDLTSYFYDTHRIHHGRKGEGNMKEEQQLSVIVIKWRQRPAWALYSPSQSQQSFRGLMRLEAPIVLLMVVYLKNGFSCKHTEMTICYSILQCCLGILLKVKNECHVPTANFPKSN